MKIDKSQIADLLRLRGDYARAEEAEWDLPDQIDTDRDGSLLDRFGLDVADLLKKFRGGGGGGSHWH